VRFLGRVEDERRTEDDRASTAGDRAARVHDRSTRARGYAFFRADTRGAFPRWR